MHSRWIFLHLLLLPLRQLYYKALCFDFSRSTILCSTVRDYKLTLYPRNNFKLIVICMYIQAVASLHTGKPGHLPRHQNKLNIIIFIIDLTIKAEKKVLR